MAEKRMFAKTIVESDAFCEMSLGAQALYFHLCMAADDDGFINNFERVRKNVNATKKNIDEIFSKNFAIKFNKNLAVIKHWKINNTIRSERHIPTLYTQEMALLCEKSNKAYTLRSAKEENLCHPDGRHDVTQDVTHDVTQVGDTMSPPDLGLGLDIDNNNACSDKFILSERAGARTHTRMRETYENPFTPPTVEEVEAYCHERGNGIDAKRFVSYYSARGWRSGKSKLTDWKALIESWEQNGLDDKQETGKGNGAYKLTEEIFQDDE